MTATPNPLLRDCIDRFARQLAEGMHAQELAVRRAIEQRLATERAPEKRKLLSLADERIGKLWRDFGRTLFDSLSHKAMILAGYVENDDKDIASSVSSLRIVDDEQMEWDLSLGGVGSRLRDAGGKSFNQLEARVAALLKKQLDDDDFNNPFGPDAQVFALKKAIEVVAPESDLRRQVLLLIEPVFTECVNAQYEAANAMLEESGVEGQVRPKIISAASRQSAGGPAAAGGQQAPEGGGRSGGRTDAGGGAGAGEGLLAMLQNLVSNSTGGQITGGAMAGGGTAGGGMGFGGMPVGMVAVPAALLESLNRLQSLDFSALQGNLTDEGGTVNVLRELRQQEVTRSLPPIEAVTIDIVATIFDFIFDDDLVPDSVKALVGRMQIPLLKVAMLDKSFFSNKEHPARVLLGDISRASIAAGTTLAQGDPVFATIKAVVNRVLKEFEQDQSVFATLLPEMKALVAEQEEKANQLADKSKRVAEQQEQVELAEVRASEVFARIIEQGLADEVPPHIGEFLARRYPLVLQRALLNGGTQGASWAVATQTLSDLLWTLMPKPTPEDRQRMVGMLPELLRRVNGFFEKVGVTAEEKAPFIDALAQHHSIVIKGVRKPHDRRAAEKKKEAEKAETAPGGTASVKASAPLDLALPVDDVVSSNSLAPMVVVTRIVQENGIEVESMTVAGKQAGAKTIRSAEVASMKRGEWVEFIDESGLPVRARLSWVSPYRGVMLFANPQSSRAISINQEALAIQLKVGKARILGDDTMVDRALGKALETMQPA